MNSVILWLAACLITFLGTVLILRRLIPYLKSKKLGQKILDIGPRWHKSKEGTPTMGGLSFITGSAIAFVAVAAIALITGNGTILPPLLITYLMASAYGLAGWLDDRTKFAHNRNEGLTAAQKYALQFGIAIAYVAAMRIFGFIDTIVPIPFLGREVDLGWFYYVIAIIALTGINNGVNFSDGLDGLCSSIVAVVAVFFTAASIKAGDGAAAALSGLMLGSALGFLVYNFYPARVFMGDTGSLFLGGLVVGCAFLLDNLLILLLVGLIYIIECMSVLLQVAYFKLTHGKRLFKMAPIHHHFEKCGWSEIKVTAVFSAFTAITCLIAWFGL
ncbi:MAG TPA: phospho-N-acetylmuramoyl-pentapeptide-transferase [Clostridiales bacterium]|jgi:phospho-N-acetylmuramoyl-pentapeptide-transferase|nr:phospho-N-acetylmuramoyl-pentapeptide-transferase [Clostridiales bacterium]